MFRPIRTLIYGASCLLMLVGIFVIVFGGWQVALLLWFISAILGWIGRKVRF